MKDCNGRDWREGKCSGDGMERDCLCPSRKQWRRERARRQHFLLSEGMPLSVGALGERWVRS